jgi:hypothetical protein
MAKAISQSDTMWVKKGDKLPDGSIAKRGVLWDTKSKKRVTGAVKLVQATKRGKAGETLSVKAGRYTKSGAGAGKKVAKAADDGRALSRRPGAKPVSVRAAAKPTSPNNSSVTAEKRVASTRRKETPMSASKAQPSSIVKAQPSWNPGGGMQKDTTTVSDFIKEFFASRGGLTTPPKKK